MFMNNTVEMVANAKVNLSLDVVRRREDNYHDLEMIMQEIDLADKIFIKEIDVDEIRVLCNRDDIPTDETNIVYKISYTIKNRFNIDKGLEIKIDKNIPIAAGLGGGSADAAATIKGINKLWNLNMSEQDMIDISKPLGADIPFCIIGGTAVARGIGDKLTKISGLKETMILLVNPEIGVSTKFVYQSLNLDVIEKRPDTGKLVDAIQANDLNYIANNMVNVLETVTIKEYPLIDKIKEEMIQYGAIGSLMSGSGSTVFGIFDDESAIDNAEKEFRKQYNLVIRTKTVERMV